MVVLKSVFKVFAQICFILIINVEDMIYTVNVLTLFYSLSCTMFCPCNNALTTTFENMYALVSLWLVHGLPLKYDFKT